MYGLGVAGEIVLSGSLVATISAGKGRSLISMLLLSMSLESSPETKNLLTRKTLVAPFLRFKVGQSVLLLELL